METGNISTVVQGGYEGSIALHGQKFQEGYWVLLKSRGQ